MSLYTFRLKAGVPFQAPISGKLILVDSTGEAESIDIVPMRGGQEDRPFPGRQKAFKCWVDFDAIVLHSKVDCTVALFLSRTDVSLGFADGANVNVRGGVSIENDPANAIPVSLQEGVVNVTATNVGISNDNDKAVPVQKQRLATIVDREPVVLAAANTAQQLIADPTLKLLRIRNGHPSATIAIGGADVSIANAAVQLLPGDVWIEDDAPGADWYAVSDVAGAIAQIQGVK
ncbi:hypothetical protein [Massilia timonae]|uniref:hypothetical protein n=1 Tax=Massilia timonae TaxID=47229 RepID=UPI0028D6F150|nr:hypothetical protein [Massilia timonae]